MFSETIGPISTLSQPTRPQSEHRHTLQPNKLQHVMFGKVKLCVQYGHVYTDTQISVRSSIRLCTSPVGKPNQVSKLMAENER
jgi:hypothetical protein